jgi:chromosome segregation ATPase
LKSIEKDYISMKNLLNNYKDENNTLKRENNQIKNENYELKKQINELKMKSNNPNNNIKNVNDNKDEIIALLKKLEIKENEIKQIRQKLPYELKSGEELMPIIFISFDQKIHYAFICKNTDKFNSIENLLYEIYPEYEESENYFTVNGHKIIKLKTMEQNNIKPSSIIMLNRYEE